MSDSWKLRAFGFALIGTVAFGSAQAVDGDVLSREPAPDAPKGVKDLQILIGDWKCGSANLQPDGTLKETPYTHDWKWYYTLQGKAIQDYWFPDEDSDGAPGTNLRMYDEESDTWQIVWTTVEAQEFLRLSSTFDGKELKLTGHRKAIGERPEHDVRVTFHNIFGDHFDWNYEARSPNSDDEWRTVARLECDRA